MWLGFVTLSILVIVESADVCCPDIGCLPTGGDFAHLLKPKCVEAKYGLFTRSNKASGITIKRNNPIPSVFKSSKRTIFVIHGYQNDMNSPYMKDIKNALLDKEDANVLLVDWKTGANEIYYPQSASNTRVIGKYVAYMMKRLRDTTGLQSSKLWCVGFSLGAHTCGFAGLSTQIERITGLDPAGPWFGGYSANARLNPSAAKLVDVIHTDGSGLAAWYGMMTPMGHMDFYPNGGNNQPGCWTNIPLEPYYADFNVSLAYMDVSLFDDKSSVACSHARAPKYFVQSIKADNCFATRQICTDERNLPKSCTSCSGGGVCTNMGYAADKKVVAGKFYLETSSKSPYCRY